MNFLAAFTLALEGRYMRRKVWRPGAMLWHGATDGVCLYWRDGVGSDTPVKLCGPDRAFDLSAEDIQAGDWEVISIWTYRVVRRDREYVTRFYSGGKLYPPADYFTTDRADAEGTGRTECARLNKLPD